MLLNCILKSKTFKRVEMKFLEVENIHTECDSTQSTTETATQYKTVFTTCDCHNVASLANMKCGPYFINQLTFKDFKDYKK